MGSWGAVQGLTCLCCRCVPQCHVKTPISVMQRARTAKPPPPPPPSHPPTTHRNRTEPLKRAPTYTHSYVYNDQALEHCSVFFSPFAALDGSAPTATYSEPPLTFSLWRFLEQELLQQNKATSTCSMHNGMPLYGGSGAATTVSPCLCGVRATDLPQTCTYS